MRVRVYKAGEYDLAGAIDLVDVCHFRCEELVLGDFVRRTDGDNLSIRDEQRAVFNDAEFAHLRAAPRAGIAGGAAQCQELSGVGEEGHGRTTTNRAKELKQIGRESC